MIEAGKLGLKNGHVVALVAVAALGLALLFSGNGKAAPAPLPAPARTEPTGKRRGRPPSKREAPAEPRTRAKRGKMGPEEKAAFLARLEAGRQKKAAAAAAGGAS